MYMYIYMKRHMIIVLITINRFNISTDNKNILYLNLHDHVYRFVMDIQLS